MKNPIKEKYNLQDNILKRLFKSVSSSFIIAIFIFLIKIKLSKLTANMKIDNPRKFNPRKEEISSIKYPKITTPISIPAAILASRKNLSPKIYVINSPSKIILINKNVDKKYQSSI